MNPANDKKKPIITPAPNGPYLVKDLEELRNSKGQEIKTRPSVALCRCGGSSNKPFCDGTHAKIGFSSEKLTDGSEDKRENYSGAEVTIHDNRGLCAHAGRCTDGLSSVFRLGQEPWIDPNGAKAEEIIATVKKCPSGALSYSIQGSEHKDQDREPAVTVSKNGPYLITGSLELVGESFRQGASREHFTLCRCGHSKNKPFCDGTHWYVKFEDDKN